MQRQATWMEAQHSIRQDSSIIAASLINFDFAVADDRGCVTIGVERSGLVAERASGADAKKINPECPCFRA